MCCFVLRANEVKGRALGFRLKQFFKLVQVQVLAEVDEKENAMASYYSKSPGSPPSNIGSALDHGGLSLTEGFSKARRSSNKGNLYPGPQLAPPGPRPCYLQDLLIIKFTEDSATDLVGFQRCPVEDR